MSNAAATTPAAATPCLYGCEQFADATSRCLACNAIAREEAEAKSAALTVLDAIACIAAKPDDAHVGVWINNAIYWTRSSFRHALTAKALRAANAPKPKTAAAVMVERLESEIAMKRSAYNGSLATIDDLLATAVRAGEHYERITPRGALTNLARAVAEAGQQAAEIEQTVTVLRTLRDLIAFEAAVAYEAAVDAPCDACKGAGWQGIDSCEKCGGDGWQGL